MTTTLDVVSAFEAKAFTISNAAAQQGASLAQQYSISATILRNQFELFAIKNQYDSFEVTEDMLGRFAAWLPKVVNNLKAQQTSGGPGKFKQAGGAVRTPLTARSSNPAAAISTPGANMASLVTPNTAAVASAQKGQIVAEYNCEASSRDSFMPQTGAACTITPLNPSPLMTQNFRYMQDTLAHKVNMLDNRIVRAEQFIESREDIEVHAVGVARQHTVTSVGRVLCDAAGGRLNAHSILLEGSVNTSQGESVALDVEALESLRLFPGQVVAVTGTNPGGYKFVASQLRTSFPPPQPKTALPQLTAALQSTGSQPMSIIIAAGPFLLPDSLAFEPLAAVVAACQEHKPSLLLLMGPFLDAAHPILATGNLEVTFDDVFESQVVDYLRGAVPQQTQVVVMPSFQDVHSPYCFPQPPFQICADGQTAGAHLHAVSNPTTFACNEVVVGAVSVDVLRHLSAAEYYRGPPQHRLTALAGHVLQQGSFYPLYPPAKGVPLDASLGSALAMKVLPDILVLPSELAPFAKVVTLPDDNATSDSTDTAMDAVPAPVSTGSAGAADESAKERVTAQGLDLQFDTVMEDASASHTLQPLQLAQPRPTVAAVASTAKKLPKQEQRKVLVINPGLACKRSALGTIALVVVTPHKEALSMAQGQPATTNAPVPHDVAARAAVQILKL